MFFDSHAHLTSASIGDQADLLVERARLAGVGQVVNICTDIPSLEKGLELTSRYPWIYQAGSTTPHDVEKEGEAVFHRFAECAKTGQFVAVGETGLDYYYEHANRQVQQQFLRRYLHLALECRLPVIIHCREAFKDFFEILDAEYQVANRHAPGVLHCFTGTAKEAEGVIERGWMLSLSGIVTFKKSLELQAIAKEIPLDQLLIETDAPYLAPQGHRGKQNEPAFLVDTAQFLANLRGISVEEVAKATTENAQRLFVLS